MYISVSRGARTRCLMPEDFNIVDKLQVPVPDNEADRLSVLRETDLTQLPQADPALERYATLCKRLFNVPFVLISIVDIDRVLPKVNLGFEGVTEIPRNNAFCAYTILPDTPDVFVVENVPEDDRFKDFGIVTGPPHIKFYAGTPVVIDNVKIGTLCVLGQEARVGTFTTEDRMCLLDLGAAVANLIRERAERSRASRKEAGNLILKTLDKFKAPAIKINQASGVVEKRVQESASTGAAQSSTADAMKAVSTLRNGANSLRIAMEVSMLYGQLMNTLASPALLNDRTGAFEFCNVMNAVYEAQRTIQTLETATSISWDIDMGSFPASVAHVCSLKAVYYVLLSCASCLVSSWDSVTVKIQYVSGKADKDRDYGYEELFENIPADIQAGLNNLKAIWKHGRLQVIISTTGHSADKAPHVGGTCNTDLQLLALDHVLREVEGGRVPLPVTSEETKLDIWVPIALLVAKMPAKPKAKPQAQAQAQADTAGAETKAGAPAPAPEAEAAMAAVSSEVVQGESGFDDSDDISYTLDLSSTPYDVLTVGSGDLTQAMCDISVTADSVDDDKNSSAEDVEDTVPDAAATSAGSSNNLVGRSSGAPRPVLKIRKPMGKTSKGPRFQAASASAFLVSSIVEAELRRSSNAAAPAAAGAESGKENDTFFTKMIRRLSDHLVPASMVTPPLRVLIIDDSKPLTKLMTKWLRAAQCDVTVAVNGKEGLSRMQHFQYDLCFIDFLMPVMHGVETLIRYSRWFKVVSRRLPEDVDDEFFELNTDMLIIGMSSNPGDLEVESAFSNGMHFYFNKPVEQDVLVGIVNARRSAANLRETLATLGHTRQLKHVDTVRRSSSVNRSNKQ